jgi:hypothetical protein
VAPVESEIAETQRRGIYRSGSNPELADAIRVDAPSTPRGIAINCKPSERVLSIAHITLKRVRSPLIAAVLLSAASLSIDRLDARDFLSYLYV